MKYRKKPVVIDAFQLGSSELPAWWNAAVEADQIHAWNREGAVLNAAPTVAHIKTLEGTMTAEKGDWIIRGIKGEIYPVKNEIFVETYEAVE